MRSLTVSRNREHISFWFNLTTCNRRWWHSYYTKTGSYKNNFTRTYFAFFIINLTQKKFLLRQTYYKPWPYRALAKNTTQKSLTVSRNREHISFWFNLTTCNRRWWHSYYTKTGSYKNNFTRTYFAFFIINLTQKKFLLRQTYYKPWPYRALAKNTTQKSLTVSRNREHSLYI